MRVKARSVALATADGFGIGLDEEGHLVEFMADWVALDPLEEVLGGPAPVYLEVADWAVIAIDDEVRMPLTREDTGAERARLARTAQR